MNILDRIFGRTEDPAGLQPTDKQVPATTQKSVPVPYGFQTVEQSRGWFRIIHEGFTGAWQRNIIGRADDVLTHAAVYACVTLIASDIGKLRIKLVEQSDVSVGGNWTEVENAAFSPVLRKPNRYQTRIKFLEQWQVSRLVHGNTYVLKQRDDRQVVEALYVLDPTRVRVQVAPDGSVYYALLSDNLSGLKDAVVIPASEIIHDVCTPLHHPLCGVSPITACGLAALMGLNMMKQSATFFAGGGVPSGVIMWPDEVSPEQQTDIQTNWEKQFTGANVGRIAVLSAGAKFEQMTMSAVDAQLIDQLKWTSEHVCTAFHVPPYMIGVGPPPTYNNIEALNQQYYSQCLQNPIESLELLLDEGLGLVRPLRYGTELDIDDLLRMDTTNRVKAAKEALGGGGMSMNEARAKYHGLGPVAGGEVPWLQEQNWPVTLLAQRELPPERPPTAPADSTAPLPATDRALPEPALDLKALEEIFVGAVDREFGKELTA
jgi:HK97 family phage portal protein